VQEQHKSHLVSTYTTVLQHLSEISAAAAGKSPGGAALTPLPEAERDRLAAGLDAVARRLKDTVEALVGDWESAAAGAGTIGATRMWVNVLLRTVEELISDLSPVRTEKRYGAMPPAEARRLLKDVEAIVSLVRRMINS
jgi:hypothetical protein